MNAESKMKAMKSFFSEELASKYLLLSEAKSMNAEQIVKALRCCLAGLCDERCPLFGETSNCEKTLMIQSADLIESQQSHIAELEKQLAAKEAVNQAYSATVSLMEIDKADAIQRAESAEKQLAESRRETRAAVEDMEHIASEIEKCDWILAKDGELVGSLHLGRCAVCNHRYCDEEIDSGCKFEWRGPQDGKGAVE